MSSYQPSQIYAALTTESVPLPVMSSKQKDLCLQQTVESPPKRSPPTRSNEIQVSALAELTHVPDRCRISITVNSKKDDVQEAKNSVSRRMDYILQVLNNHQIKEGDINVCKVLKREGSVYIYDAEITVTFIDVNKCQGVTNFLVEKLDHNVHVSQPEFFQSPQRLESLRRQASLTAVKNAKTKAAEIAQFLNAKVGQPISIREEYCNEVEGPAEGATVLDGPVTIQNRMSQAAITVSVKVTASFELKPKAKVKPLS